ncbi:MAG TPA: C39 family peptidase [Candidatus Dormibacteraeota bacterium]|nr:C39 family peptidase [Candidatus Dormibacteraeota bacterium]
MSGRRPLLAALAAIVLVAVVGAAGLGYRYWRHQQELRPRPAPRTAVVIAAPTPAATPASTPIPSPTPLPPSVFVKVPYTSQSPYDQWGANDPHQEYCEAAALLMVSDYFRGDRRSTIPPAEANAGMAAIVDAERRMFPGVLDLPVADVAQVGQHMFGLQPSVVPLDLTTIERNLAEGRPVIIPVMTHGLAGGAPIAPYYGRANVYHVIVVTGYDAARNLLYTNDAGFMQGQNYAYPWSVLEAANAAQTHHLAQGQVMLIFSSGS